MTKTGGNALILLCALALATAKGGDVYANGCPKDWNIEQLFPHNNCHKFYQCWDGQLVVHKCPSKLFFSIEHNRCEWAEEVDCSGREIPDDNNDGGNDNENNDNGGGICNCNPEEAPSICAADNSEGVLVAHENCNQFYVCNGGKPVALSCPGNLLFNPYTNQCDWPDKVACGDRVIPDADCDENENGDDNNDSGDNGSGNGDNGDGGGDNGGGTCNCKPEEAPAICAADDSNGVLVAHENCNQFYICCDGKPVAFSCPGNLLFNPYTNQCDWPDKVDCGDRVIPDGDCDENGNGGNGNGSGDNGGGGNGESGNGDNGNGGGDNGGGDNGGGGNGGGTCNCKPEEAPAICAADDSNGVLIAHENCNQFYICSDGKPVALSCPGNLLFNPYTNQCDWPDKVDCGDRVVPEGDCDDNGNGGDGNGSGDNGGGGNGDSGNGDNGNGGGDNGGGDNGGGGNGGGTCNCKPEEAPAICAADDSNGVLIAHENCNQFYICSDGKPVAFSCPGNLLFNPYTNQCDWPDKVDCGNRVIPDGDCDENGNGGNGNGSGDNGGGGNGESGNGDNGNGSGNNGDGDNGGGGNGGGTCNCKPEEAPAICAADDSNGVLIAHENCNQFYICSDGKPVALSCPGNLLFNPYTNQCDWPDKVDCGNRVVPESDCDENGNGGDGNGSGDNGGGGNGDNGNGDNGNGGGDSGGGDNGGGGNGGGTCNCKPEEAPAICAADDSNGVLVAHENCNQFYICCDGKPVAFSCPGNLLFNPYTNQCDWPDKVDCGDRVIPGGDCDENGTGGDGNGSGDNGGGGNGDSGNGDNGNGGGDNGSGDNGGGGNGGGSCNCRPEEAPSICAADDSNGVLIAHENCNQFYICSDGKPVALSCPGNLLFNPYTNQCDWPDKVDCGNRVVPEGDCDENGNGSGDNGGGGNGDSGNGDNGGGDNGVGGGNGDNGNGDNGSGGGTCNCKPEEAPAICAADDSEGVLVAHENCNQFYVCNGGKPVVLTCPGNLLFNPYANQCDWPDKVACGDRVIPDGDCDENGNGGNGNGDNGGGGNGDNDNGGGDNGGGTCNCNPEEAPAICAADDSEGVLVAHENCNQFYVCNGGKPVVLTCPGNLLFNPYANQCDWPDKVACGDRVIPDGDCDENGNGGNGNGSGDNGGGGNGDNGNGGGDNGGGTCNCNPEEAPAICAADDSEGVLVAHNNCNQFYVCNGGKPVVLTCPGNLLFNPYANQCDWPENVKCNDRNEDDKEEDEEIDNNELPCMESNGGAGNDNPSQAPAICASQDSEGVLVAHENCNKFYICDHYKPVEVNCPSKLLFNPYNDKCDWSHCVQCGNRFYDKDAATYTSLNKHLPARQSVRVLY